MGMNHGLFDAEGFRRRLQGLTDDELITTGKTVSPEASHWEDPKTIADAENAQNFDGLADSKHGLRWINSKGVHSLPSSDPTWRISAFSLIAFVARRTNSALSKTP